MTRHYLDHASTSPLRPAAFDAMTQWLRQPHGDPSRIHHEGLTARVAIEDARAEVAAFLGARSREVVFTSGASESIASATWGAAPRGSHMVASVIEHSAVRQSTLAFEAATSGAVTFTGCDRFGRIDPDEIVRAITADTALVHIQWANHEVGTVQPVAEVVAACREREVLVHVDAATAAGHLPISFRDLGADLLSVSAHKLGGPPGVGALLIRRGLRIHPLLVGGDQERARRAGFENVPGIVGFGATCAALFGQPLIDEMHHQTELTRRVLAGVEAIDGVSVYGDPVDRVPHLVCLGIDGIEPQGVLLGLDQAGIAAHSGSACSSEALEPSPVLEAMGVDAHRSLRVSVGWNSTDADVDHLLVVLPRVVAQLRSLGS